MPLDRDMVEIIHPGAPKMFIGDGKPCRFDDRGRDAKASAHAQHGPAILRNIRLIKGKRQRRIFGQSVQGHNCLIVKIR
jgi:hypothetical protein